MIIKKLDPLERYEIEMLNGKKVEFVITESTPEYLRFESRNCLGERVPMTEMNEWLHKQFSLLPDEIKTAIIPTERLYRDSKGEVHKETVKLFLPSAPEIFSEDECNFSADTGLYKQLDYYKDAHNRVRASKDGHSYAQWYWTSSRRLENSTDWCYVYYDGCAAHADEGDTWIYATICFRIKNARWPELFNRNEVRK